MSFEQFHVILAILFAPAIRFFATFMISREIAKPQVSAPKSMIKRTDTQLPDFFTSDPGQE
jgi:hypothetical protein